MQLTTKEQNLSERGFVNISQVEITCAWGDESQSFRLMDKSFFSRTYPLLASRHMDDPERTWLMVFDPESHRIWYKDGKSCRTDEIMLMLLVSAGYHHDSLLHDAFNLLKTPFAFSFAFDEGEFLARKSDPLYKIPISMPENLDTEGCRRAFSHLKGAMEGVFAAYAAEITRRYASLNPAVDPVFMELFPYKRTCATILYPFYLGSVCTSVLNLTLPYMPIEKFVELISTS